MENSIKFIDAAVVTEEIPSEITLAVEITNCPHKCVGCHSPQLQENIGNILNSRTIDWLIDQNKFITCFCFMGGDADHTEVARLADYIRSKNIKTAMYSGDDFIDKSLLPHLDYYKVGSYQKGYGPLKSRGTNQRLYSIVDDVPHDITYMFWSGETIDAKVSEPLDESKEK